MTPPGEPPCRRAGIEPRDVAKVFAHIVEHVDERVPHLARRLEQVRVKAVPPDPPMAPESAVHGLREADREPAHTTLELRRPVRLYQQVQMIGLDAVVQNAEPTIAGDCERLARRAEQGRRRSEGRPVCARSVT